MIRKNNLLGCNWPGHTWVSRPEKYMILWTIQTEDAWSELQTRGVLRATRQDVEKDFLHAYEWMIEQMERRLAPRPRRNQFPLWAWRQWENEVRAKPDLRSSGHIPKGQEGVRIEFELPENLALLSDFGLWHYVLNYWYLAQSEPLSHCPYLANQSRQHCGN